MMVLSKLVAGGVPCPSHVPTTPAQLMHACSALQGQLEGAKSTDLPIRKLENFSDTTLEEAL